jgi:hypothetical protein
MVEEVSSAAAGQEVASGKIQTCKTSMRAPRAPSRTKAAGRRSKNCQRKKSSTCQFFTREVAIYSRVKKTYKSKILTPTRWSLVLPKLRGQATTWRSTTTTE